MPESETRASGASARADERAVATWLGAKAGRERPLPHYKVGRSGKL